MATQDEMNFNNLHNLLTANLTVKEAKSVLVAGANYDGVICTNMNSYTPLKEDYIDAIMSGFFYLHHLNGHSNTAKWLPCNNWEDSLIHFNMKTAIKIQDYMKEVRA